MKFDNEGLVDALAAEYVLGTLKGGARRRFEKAMEQRPEVATAVSAWDLRLNKLCDNAIPAEPPAKVWAELDQRLFQSRSVEPAATPNWYDRLAVWRSLTIGSTAIAGVLAVVLLIGNANLAPQTGGETEFVVLIQNDEQQAVWTASASVANNQVLVRNHKPMTVPENSGCMLWVQPAGSDRFMRVGLLPDDGSVATLDLDKQLRQAMLKGKLFVTMENKNELPHSPSRPADFTGQLVPVSSSI